MTNERIWIRYAAIAGIIAVVLSAIGALLPGAPPAPDSSAATLRDYFSTHRSAIVAGNYLSGLGLALLIWFFSGLRAVLLKAEGEQGSLANAAFAAGVATAIVALTGTGIYGALALNPQRDDAILRALFDSVNVLYSMLFFFPALLLFTASIVIVRTAVLPRWIAVLGFLTTIVLVVIPAGMGMTSGILAAGGPLPFMGFLLSMLWMLLVAVVMLRNSARL